MAFSLQSREIAKKIYNKIAKLQTIYIEKYGDVAGWDRSERQFFMVNCDTEILALLDKEGINVHNSAYEFGITYGLLIIKIELIDNIYENPEKLSSQETLEMHNELYDSAMYYLLKGVKKIK